MAVYNAEQYLEESINSVIRQTMDDWQLICIDDGSTDRSCAVIESFMEQDKRIEMIKLDKNYGLDHARNEGLKKANGDYITFLDADDWYDDDTLQKAVDMFVDYPQTDCILFNVIFCFSDGSTKGYDWRYPVDKYPHNDDGSFIVMSGYDAFVYSLSWQIHGVYILKSDIFKKYPYDESCHHFSGDNTTRPHFRDSREVRCCSGRYNYRQQTNSISHVVSTSRMDHMKANMSMKRMLLELGESNKIIDMYEYERWKIIVDSYMFYYIHRNKFSLSDRKYCLDEIKRAWESIEISRLKKKDIMKLGYYHFRKIPFGWCLFKIQEEVYFGIKRITGRI